MKNPDGSGEIRGPDAIVDGKMFEFKVITGSIDKVESRFRESRGQGKNIFIRVENPNITKQDVIKKLTNVINDKKYLGGYQGNIAFALSLGESEKTYYLKIKDLKRKKKTGKSFDSP
jgi:hypothetical protein